MIMNTLADYQELDEDGHFLHIGEYDNDQMFDFIKTFEEKLDKKRSGGTKGLEKFLEEDEEKPEAEE